MLAYVVDSTAAPICVLVPLSTWAVYFAALLEEEMEVGAGQGLLLYMDAIPSMFYAWAAVIIVPLVILGKIPLLGAMRKAQAEVRATRVPEGEAGFADGIGGGGEGKALLNFFVPILALIFLPGTWTPIS